MSHCYLIILPTWFALRRRVCREREEPQGQWQRCECDKSTASAYLTDANLVSSMGSPINQFFPLSPHRLEDKGLAHDVVPVPHTGRMPHIRLPGQGEFRC